MTTSIYSQKDPFFLTKFYFEDAVGNMKEIEIGYDTLASNCFLNLEFGEVLDNSPMVITFDVRAASVLTLYGFSTCEWPKKYLF